MKRLKDPLKKKDKRSLYNLCPKDIQKAMASLPQSILLMDEKELANNINATPTMRVLRVNFWQEYTRVQQSDIPKIDLNKVCDGICNPLFLVEKVFSTHHLTAWMITPPASYNAAMEETLRMGVLRFREIFEMPMMKPVMVKGAQAVDSNGKPKMEPDTKMINIMLRAFAIVDQRMQGGIVQRHQIDSHHKVTRDITPELESMSMEQIDSRIAELNEKDKIVAIDVSPKKPLMAAQKKMEQKV